MASEVHHQYHIIDIDQWHFNKRNGSSINYFNSCSQGLFLLLCFIATLILLPSLFLCIHFCRRRFSHQQQPNSTMVMISPQPQHGSTNYYHTTSIMVVGDAGGFENYKKERCSICLSVFQENEKLAVLKECQHTYHSECLDMWLSVHLTCPLCRSNLPDPPC